MYTLRRTGSSELPHPPQSMFKAQTTLALGLNKVELGQDKRHA